MNRMKARIPLIIAGLGLVLMAVMIAVEDEPGGIPVIMVLGGVIWYLIAKRKSS